MKSLKRVIFSKFFASLPESRVERLQPSIMLGFCLVDSQQVPGVVEGGEEVVEEVVAEGGEDEQQAALVQVPHRVQLVVRVNN